MFVKAILLVNEISTNIFMIDERVEYPEQCLIYTYLKISILSNLLIQRLNNNTFFTDIRVHYTY